MKKFGLTCISVVVLFIFYASAIAGPTSTLDEVKKRGVVRIGSGTTVPPMNYIDENGVWTGFDLDLGDAIAKRLGVKVERVNVNNKTRVAFLATARIDLTISNMSHTKSRDEQIDYAEPPYLWSGKIFYAKEGKFKSVKELGGKRIAVVQGSNAYIAAPQYLAEITDEKPIMMSFQTNSECFMALKQGKVDAYTQDTPIIAGVAGSEGLDYEAVGPIYSPGLYGIGVPPNDSKWRDKISFILQDLLKDGTYEKIYQKWFGPTGKFPLPINARPRLPEDIFGKMVFVWPD
ncbi:amino acid ABC transporter substrate-binding protein [Candidatus Bathyarchaeota archaeon]|nr:MAG: amino acid ABC transporter substrate-binding protein [Candidatus Bathyarchaeota archaeon]